MALQSRIDQQKSIVMGIPRFYKWLRTRYPQIRMDLTDGNKQTPIIDNLYLDFNGIIYRCLSDYECFLKNKFEPLTFEEIYDRVYAYMMQIIEKVDPQKLIFIGFDGVAPRAKINQSRDRRFRGIQDRRKLGKLLETLKMKDNQNFQLNSISPGTDFLTNLCTSLKKKVMSLFESEWKHLKVFYSDCLAPGEGEHKILDFLRQSKRLNLFDKSTTHCVYSADADVILLCLSLNLENICILREDSTKNNFGFVASTNVRHVRSPEFEYIFINILREYFTKQFSDCLPEATHDIQPVINDFILLMAFVGNDFLPVEFCFTIKQVHMENLYKSYKQYLLKTKKFINNNGVIDWSGIETLLEIAKKFEAEMLDEKIKNKRNLINQRQMQKQSGLRPIKEEKEEDEQSKSDDDEVQNFEVEDNKIVKGKELYYKTRFGIEDRKTDPKFKDIIIKYIEGLEFYNQYYFQGVPSWTWYYPYHYTPLLTDVHEYLLENKINVKLNKGQPYDPYLALMFMLPLASLHILPQVIADAIRDPKCILRTPLDYFPQQFKLDKYEALQFHKRALIPFLNEADVRTVYQSIDRIKYTDKEKEKNSRGNTLYFRFVGPVMSGAEVYFGNEESEKALLQFLKQDVAAESKSKARERFPSLKIFGEFTLDEKGKMQITRKYHYEGSPAELVFYNNFLGYVDEMIPCPEHLKVPIEMAYREIGIEAKCANLFRIKQAKRIRESGYFTYIKTGNEVKVPDFAVFKVPKYEYIHEVGNFDIRELYRLGERVIVLAGKYFGYVGSVEKLDQKTAQIRLVEPSAIVNHKIQQTQQQFYSLQRVADDLELEPEVVLALLDEIIILPKSNGKKNQFDEIFPTGVNMGLNIINTQKGLLVPQYARCQMEYENTEKVYEIFKKVELSESCRTLLGKYVQSFEWVVEYIEQCVEERDFGWRKGIPVRNVLSLEADINLKLYQQFLKLYQFSVSGYFYSIYSKVAGNDIPPISPTERAKETLSLPYHEFISKRQARISPPAMRSEPQFHDIGDRVALLRTLETGYIIGIDDFRVYVKVPKRTEPVVVPFLDAFNSKWSSYLSKEPGKCWEMGVSYYCPQHYTKVKELE